MEKIQRYSSLLFVILACYLNFGQLLLVGPTLEVPSPTVIVCTKENIALNKPAAQSTPSSLGAGGEAPLAVDGNRSPHFSDGSCTQTEPLDGHHWWFVDLLYVTEISNVTITNRASDQSFVDYIAGLENFEINLSNVSTVLTTGELDASVLCYHQRAPLGDGETRSFLCTQPVTARLVQIRLLDTAAGSWSLCEVQVEGDVCAPENITTTAATTAAAAAADIKSTAGSSIAYTTTSCASCTCGNPDNIPHTEEELMEKIETLKTELTVDKTTTSAHKRKLISAPDNRPSSQSIGSVAVLMLCVPAVFIVALDMSRCVSWWSIQRHQDTKLQE